MQTPFEEVVGGIADEVASNVCTRDSCFLQLPIIPFEEQEQRSCDLNAGELQSRSEQEAEAYREKIMTTSSTWSATVLISSSVWKNSNAGAMLTGASLSPGLR